MPWTSVPLDSITTLLGALVRIPSRAGEDSPLPICDFVEAWLAEQAVAFRRLSGGDGGRLGVYAEVVGSGPGPWTVLDATLDTAGFGTESSWSHSPTDAVVDDGWLQGRGSADSKAGAAVFCHLLLALKARSDWAGRVGLLLDCDEHTGRFGGARAFFDHGVEGGCAPRPDGVFIGYPGMDRIVTGCRGFLRASIQVHGRAAHSGSASNRGVNAIGRAVQLAQALVARPPASGDDTFGLPPQITVTGIHGGGDSFGQIPDLCELRLDIRLTPEFSDARARQWVGHCLGELDAGSPDVPATVVDWLPGWPAYQLPADQPMVAALRAACREVLGRAVPTAVVGPSNIGNYLATLGVPALCGFGVRAEGIHAANERIALDTIGPVYQIYFDAVLRIHRG